MSKKIFLKKYFDTFVITDVTLKQSIGSGHFFDDIIHQRINEIQLEFLSDLKNKKVPSKMCKLLRNSFKVAYETYRCIERLENICRVYAYIEVDDDFYEKYHQYLSKYLNM